jgi:hypothetical protein
MLQQSGGTIDAQELVHFYMDALGLPELGNVVTFAQPPTIERPTSSGGSSMPAETTRNYVRRNVPTGGTPEARSANMQATLLNGAANQDQVASLTR